MDDEARSKGVGVLVHCLAGVSRSVTFTLAYLMFKLHLSLNDAFDFVRRRKGNIAPNFTFLGQLLEFERQQLPALRARHRELLDDHPESSSLDSTATMSKAVGGGGGGNTSLFSQ
ncbi:unnamed protein product [Notodromas monacha]|uniref:protein-tyrosine-phosphatase n=1 Tax=Notodromas monacha TaxID=399045 RepID=A0A7R9GAJ0_9CRUS|nr:unnamed protein product [Notodromas monacha]CAG0915429.1 unnamed protein product [Notodromas monacha]